MAKNSTNMSVSVVGLGFVGAPLLRAFANSGYSVRGVDLAQQKLSELSADPQLHDVEFSTNLMDCADSDVFVLALPTPLLSNGGSDLSALVETCEALGSLLTSAKLVIIESTYPVGTTRNLLLPLLGKKIGIEAVQLVYSPERINPGDLTWELENTPKLVAAESSEAKKKMIELYGKVFEELVFVDSFEIAEAAKLLENIYRFVNINFINEFQQNCEALGIDASKVIAAASTKPFGFQKFTPSLGIGGHCIPIAPHHFAESLKEQRISNGFIDHGTKINQSHLLRVLEKIERDYVNLEDKHVLVAGVTYKPGVPDTRESPAVTLLTHLRGRGVQVSWFDPLVSSLNGEERGELPSEADLALICVQQPGHVVAEILANFEMVLDISSGLEIRRLK